MDTIKKKLEALSNTNVYYDEGFEQSIVSLSELDFYDLLNDFKMIVHQVEVLEESVSDYLTTNQYLHKKWRDRRRESNQYKRVLEFYADKKNYEVTGEKVYNGHGDFTEETWVEVDRDHGKKAREVLEQEEVRKKIEGRNNRNGGE